MYQAFNKILPHNIQSFEFESTRPYYTRHVNTFRTKFVRTNLKSMCISVKGVKI